ncbi:hypothetical protein BU16DRAFT_16275 [Lophium mytilinum]|uniref:Uncharacterized protein n=1 Tax=Lophium mytilinum TaxID=390894 RepID=A0A6A6RD20_9PEZI|nr:hypothetical protein BU16DRAFT_16275 [Lophium mytilinum]
MLAMACPCRFLGVHANPALWDPRKGQTRLFQTSGKSRSNGQRRHARILGIHRNCHTSYAPRCLSRAHRHRLRDIACGSPKTTPAEAACPQHRLIGEPVDSHCLAASLSLESDRSHVEAGAVCAIGQTAPQRATFSSADASGTSRLAALAALAGLARQRGGGLLP